MPGSWTTRFQLNLEHVCGSLKESAAPWCDGTSTSLACIIRIKALSHRTMPKQRTFFMNFIQPVVDRCTESTSTFTRSIHSQSMQVGLRSVCETEGGMILFESPKLVKIRTRSAIGVSLCGQNIPEWWGFSTEEIIIACISTVALVNSNYPNIVCFYSRFVADVGHEIAHRIKGDLELLKWEASETVGAAIP